MFDILGGIIKIAGGYVLGRSVWLIVREEIKTLYRKRRKE